MTALLLVFPLLNATLPGQLIYRVVVARIASSLVNFSVNRKLVFKHHGNSRRCFVRYYLLVFVVSFFIQREFVYKEAPDTQPESDPEGW